MYYVIMDCTKSIPGVTDTSVSGEGRSDISAQKLTVNSLFSMLKWREATKSLEDLITVLAKGDANEYVVHDQFGRPLRLFLHFRAILSRHFLRHA